MKSAINKSLSNSLLGGLDLVFLDDDSLPEGELISSIYQAVERSHLFIGIITKTFLTKPFPMKEMMRATNNTVVMIAVDMDIPEIMQSNCRMRYFINKFGKDKIKFIARDDKDLITKIQTAWFEHLQKNRSTVDTLTTTRQHTIFPRSNTIYIHEYDTVPTEWKNLVESTISEYEGNFEITPVLGNANVAFIYIKSTEGSIPQAIRRRSSSYNKKLTKETEESIRNCKQLQNEFKEASEKGDQTKAAELWGQNRVEKKYFIPFAIVPFFEEASENYPLQLRHHKGCGNSKDLEKTRIFVLNFLKRNDLRSYFL